jgi:hypothetical protein
MNYASYIHTYLIFKKLVQCQIVSEQGVPGPSFRGQCVPWIMWHLEIVSPCRYFVIG